LRAWFHTAIYVKSQWLMESGKKGQLELGISRDPEKDRNHHFGGRSFYFFDFDDNIAFLTTPIYIFHKDSGSELPLSSGEYAQSHTLIGKSGPYRDYEIRYDDRTGTYRNFRDQDVDELIKLGSQRQVFVEDVCAILDLPDVNWKGPSWETFYHATFNQRPVSLITARGHHPDTLKEGVREFVRKKWLPLEPNYLSVFPVSHIPTRKGLGDETLNMSIAELKQCAIRASVEQAIDIFGENPHHRFGMSDDDPRNIQLIVEEMTRLKSRYPQMSFFMIETHNGNFVKHQVTLSGLRSEYVENQTQMSLFEGR
jgi:hypothetical protein